MLQILSMHCPYVHTDILPNRLYVDNYTFTFEVRAPIFWWIDFDGIRFGFDLSEFSEFEKQNASVSTNVVGWIYLEYRDIVDICSCYLNGAYKYDKQDFQWSNEREWSDFCETLLDIKGVRDLIEEAE